MRKIFGLLCAAILCGCTSETVVPRINAAEPPGTAQIQGKYAAIVQGGQWTLADTPQTRGTCKFTYYVDDAYDEAVKTSLASVFANLDFVSAPLTPTQLRERGYDAEIVVRQGTISASHRVQSGATAGTATLFVDLNLVDGHGLDYRQSLGGTGRAANAINLTCGSLSDVGAEAFQAALRDAMHSVVLTVRHQLDQRSTP